MANPFPSGDPDDDPLALFGAETDTTAATPALKRQRIPAKPVARDAEAAIAPGRRLPEFTAAGNKADIAPSPSIAPADEAGNVIYPTPSVLKKMAAAVPEPTPATRDLAVEVVGPPPPAGSISFDRICSLKGLGFVDGVALIQTTCEAVAAEGQAAGVPELHGLFLTADGQVVLHGPPTGEPPARELALLLHQLVAPNLMPPAGRLFVGRWMNNDSQGLTEFASELAYFARPNSREMLGTLHRRCDEIRTTSAQIHRLEPKRPAPVRQMSAVVPQGEPERLPPLRAWMKFHKPEVFVAFVVLIAMTTTAIATLLSNPKAAEGRPPVEESTAPLADGAVEAEASNTARTSKPPVSPATRRNDTSSRRASATPQRTGTANPPATSPLVRRRTPGNQPGTTAIESQDAARGVPPQVVAPVLTARAVPDLRIYSTSDGGVEPPRLRSAEIPELLIAGFEKRTNRVELVISERGDVQQARMIGPPQRMPDIMLLSRAKELLFDPAVRNGVPVRYRLILSWNVTP